MRSYLKALGKGFSLRRRKTEEKFFPLQLRRFPSTKKELKGPLKCVVASTVKGKRRLVSTLALAVKLPSLNPCAR